LEFMIMTCINCTSRSKYESRGVRLRVVGLDVPHVLQSRRHRRRRSTGRVLVQRSSAAPKRGGYRPLQVSSMTRLGLARISGSITSPANVFVVRAIVSLHATFGGVGRSSSVQNTVAAARWRHRQEYIRCVGSY